MEAKVQKTIFGFRIKSFEFLRTYNYRLRKHVISGVIWLEDSKRVKIERGKYYLIDEKGVEEGIVLKSNPGFNRIKRMIGRYFSSYRKGGKSFFREKISGLRSRITDALHDCNLFRISNISFTENRSNFLKLAS
ncbi:hypothetical protein [Chryseobacterium indologenes]|uniref:hypothetical protein n=1 Tax=Chryseobacterium indologenes TaxID=253 RepID=UPI001629F896|nr:hypothetical protein [Chryseobacterium indologenes]